MYNGQIDGQVYCNTEAEFELEKGLAYIPTDEKCIVIYNYDESVRIYEEDLDKIQHLINIIKGVVKNDQR